MTSVACIGEAMIELSMTGPGEARVGVAGDTLNTAIYLKRAAPDVTVEYVTRLGDDPFSDRIRRAMEAEDIGTGRIETLPGGSPGLYAISTTETGERSFTYWRSAAAARSLFLDGAQVDPGAISRALAGFDLVYLSGITLAVMAPAARDALLEHLVGTGVPLAFDNNYRPALWPDRPTAEAAMTSYAAAAAILLPSLDDEMALTGETEEAATTRISAMGAAGAIKRGAAGPLSLGAAVDQVYPPAARVVDTTAAGDSFNGAYLAAHLAGQDQATALMQAHLCAAHVVQHPGAIVPRQTAAG